MLRAARRPLARSLLPFLSLVLLTGCGAGARAQQRPLLTGSFPAEGALVSSGLSVLRLDFDEPIRLFLPYQLLVRREGELIGVALFQLASEGSSVRASPLVGQAFTPGSYQLEVRQGLVLNAEDHYALDVETVRFTIGGTPPLYVGSPLSDSVTQLDPTTFASLASTPTPAGRDPVGLFAVTQGATTQVYVQLATGGGTGRALARHAPGAGAMTEVLLTTSGGDLLAPAPTLLLALEGDLLYAAFRDVSAGRVRLARVRVADGVETGSLLLSVPASPSTAPTSTALRGDGVTLLVGAEAAGAGFVAYVDLVTFTEVDRDAGTLGTQAASLGSSVGPGDVVLDTWVAAPVGAVTADITTLVLGSDALGADASLQVGSPRALRGTFDGIFVLEGLATGPLDEPLTVRSSFDLATDTPLDVSDDVGGVDQGTTTIRAITLGPAQRFVYVLLDANVLTRFAWSASGFVQDDLDGVTAGTQAVLLTGSAAGATCVGTLAGATP